MMARLLHIMLLAVTAMMVSLAAQGQRRITPTLPQPGVNENRDNQPAIDRSRLKETTDASGVIVLVDTVTGEEVVDSTLLIKAKPNLFPLLQDISVGVNVYDAFMRLLGQQYGLASVRGEVNLHNRYRPYFELGFSKAAFTPDGNNYTFDSPLAPYFKIGAGYNIFYNSNPDYSLWFSLGYGFSSFKYSYKDVTVDEGYWHDPSHFDLPSQRASVGYLEVGVGIRVKIAGPISAGWQVAFHKRLNERNGAYGPPAVIPGYGKRDGSLGVSVFVAYRLPLPKHPKETSQSQ